MATNKWWHTDGTRLDTYILAGLIVTALVTVFVLGVLLWVLNILISEPWFLWSVLIGGGSVTLVVLIAETIHARSHRGS